MKHLKDIEALPSKRIYLSIIADYHLKTALCELIDNAIDNWLLGKEEKKLTIHVDLDYQQQVIRVTDNSGGVREADINLIVSPGQSKNITDNPSIGIFGVGSKRAVVALAEETRIYSRYKDEKTLLVEIKDEWIKDDSTWELPVYTVDDLPEATTKIELVKLRDRIKEENEDELREHLGATYALFLDRTNFELLLNDTPILPVTFDKWSYPPGHEPKKYTGKIDFGKNGSIDLEILGGLTKSGEPSGAEYGAYFYCNNRLITKAFKGAEVGYRPLKIGNPHPSVSLARVIVKIGGPPQLMPWNSSKSEINSKHSTFKEIQEHVDRILTYYSKLSKTWSTDGGWEENVFQYKAGVIAVERVSDMAAKSKLYLPPIPRARRRKYADVIKADNRDLAKEKPWVVGLYETIIAVEEIGNLKLTQKNRINLLSLDSMLEIAFKEYLVNDSGTAFSQERLEKLMKNRAEVHAEVKKTIFFPEPHWKRIEYFYKLRCELVHKRANITISDDELESFKATVKETLARMFKLSFPID